MVQKVPQSGISGNSSFKNFFINGDFVIAQRATSATAAGDGTYTTLDRMQTYNNGTSGAYNRYLLLESLLKITIHKE